MIKNIQLVFVHKHGFYWVWNDSGCACAATTSAPNFIPDSIYRAGKTAVSEAFRALLLYIDADLRKSGWRFKSTLIERIPVNPHFLAMETIVRMVGSMQENER